MKTKFKLLLLFMAVFFVSCTEKEEISESRTMCNVTFEQLVDDNLCTRATLAGAKVSWEANDKFVLNYGDKKAIFDYVTNTGFKTSELIKKADKYYGFFSAECVESFNKGVYCINIPSVQTSDNGNITSSSLRFAATTASANTIAFKLVCGVVDIQLQNLNRTVDKVTVTSTLPIAGKAEVDADNLTCTVKGGNTITIEGNISQESAHCAVVLPVGKQTLTITTYAGDETITNKVLVDVKRAILTKTTVNTNFKTESISESVILLNEGNWQSDNGQISYIKDHTITNQWFRSLNGTKIGDTPEDVLYIQNKDMIAISVNWSNLVYFLSKDGRIIATTENVPNCRALATDGDYLYITSYAHEAADGNVYEGGYVAKIDLTSFEVVQTYPTGYEPEGIAYYNGKLYVANTGGYAFQESHSYEHTVSVIDLVTGQREDIEIMDNGEPVINLYGEMSQVGPYLCINSPGDYNSIQPATVIFDCRDNSYSVISREPCTYNTVTSEGKFLTVGSSFSYSTGKFEYCINTINPVTKEVQEGFILNGKKNEDFRSAIENMQNPYCVYINPYTQHLYATDAASYASAGQVYEWDEKGLRVGEPMNCYINPGHMCGLPYVIGGKDSKVKSHKTPKHIKKQRKLNANRHESINEYYRNRI